MYTHPTKNEVRFRDARNVHDFIHSSLAGVLNSPTLFSATQNTQSNKYVSSESMHEETRPVLTRDIIATYTTGSHKPVNRIQANDNLVSIMQGRFIFAEKNDRFILIDVYRARELILSARIFSAWKNDRIKSRPLLVPVTLSLSVKDMELLFNHKKLMHDLGILIEQITADSIVIREIPVLLSDVDIIQMIHHIVDIIRGSPESITAKLIIDVIKTHANDALSNTLNINEMNDLIEEMQKIEKEVSTCEFNKAFRYIDQATLENFFK